MKYLIVLCVLFTGCATAPSKYVEGCEDGIQDFVLTNLHAFFPKQELEENCQAIENFKIKSTFEGRKEK